MAQNINPTFVKTPNAAVTAVTTGTVGFANVTLYSGAANGSKIPALIAVAVNTTAAYDGSFSLSTGGTFYNLGTVSIPINAGIISGTPAVNMFANSPGLTIDSDGNPFLFLPSSAWSLAVQVRSISSQWATTAAVYFMAPSIGDF